jgi:hypothetical protein
MEAIKMIIAMAMAMAKTIRTLLSCDQTKAPTLAIEDALTD